VDASATTPAATAAIQATLAVDRNWLLIFDNAEDPQKLLSWLPPLGGHIVITTRQPGWDEIATPIDIDVFDRAESVALLQRRNPELPTIEADRLAGLSFTRRLPAECLRIIGAGVTRWPPVRVRRSAPPWLECAAPCRPDRRRRRPTRPSGWRSAAVTVCVATPRKRILNSCMLVPYTVMVWWLASGHGCCEMC
jgi:hypothetical protein